MKPTTLLTVFAFTAGLAAGQIPSDSYRMAPFMLKQETSPSGVFSQGFQYTADPLLDAVIDGRSEVIGAPLGAATTDLVASDQLVDHGGGSFTLTLRIESTVTLSPSGLMNNGLSLDWPGVEVIGLDFAAPAIVTSALVSAFDANGSIFQPLDLRTRFPGFFNGPGGGWPGSLSVAFTTSQPLTILAWEVVIDYQTTAGAFVTTGAGCPPAAPMTLLADSSPAVGGVLTLTCDNVPISTTALSLIFGTAPGRVVPLDALGAPGCTLLIDNIYHSSAMPIGPGGTGVRELPFPNDPAAVGAAFQAQAVAIAPVNALGAALSNLASVRLGPALP